MNSPDDDREPFEEMPTGGTATAYPNGQSSSWTHRIYLFLGLIVVTLIFRNALFTDYTDETKNYLRSIGRSDSIDNVIPKTSTDIANDKKLQSQTINELVKNVTTLQGQYQSILKELEEMKAADKPPAI